MTKINPCQREHNKHINSCWPAEHEMHLKRCWQNPIHFTVYTKCISNTWWSNPSLASYDTKSILSCLDQTRPMLGSTQNAYLLLLTKPNPCQRAHKMHLNMCWPFHPMPARLQNASQHAMSKPLLCQREHQIHLNMCLRNPFHYEDTKFISTCVEGKNSIATRADINPLLPAWTQYVSQFVLNKPLQC